MSTLHGSMSVGGSFSNKVCVYLTWMSLLDDRVFPFFNLFCSSREQTQRYSKHSVPGWDSALCCSTKSRSLLLSFWIDLIHTHYERDHFGRPDENTQHWTPDFLVPSSDCLGHFSKNKKEIKLQLQTLGEVHSVIHFGNVTLLCNIFTICWHIKSGGRTWGTTAGVQVRY